MNFNPPDPRPYMIESHGYFVVDPGQCDNLDLSALQRLKAMKPDERLRWHEAWKRHGDNLERAGKDVGKEVFGIEGIKQECE
jgi:hypothetical protein